MTRKVLILGGYGNFGRRISEALVKANIPIVIAGRNQHEAGKQYGTKIVTKILKVELAKPGIDYPSCDLFLD